MKKEIGTFDYITDICQKNLNITDFSKYSKFLVLRGLSNYYDTVLLANEMNLYPNIPGEYQFHFLKSLITKKKRWSKWSKKKKVDNIEIVKQSYKVSDDKAIGILELLSPDQLDQLTYNMRHGGRGKK